MADMNLSDFGKQYPGGSYHEYITKTGDFAPGGYYSDTNVAGVTGVTDPMSIGQTATSTGFDWSALNPFTKDGALSTDVKGAGGSNFSNTAQGLGSLYGIYAANQGIKAAKAALGFEKQKYADLKALQDKSDANKEKFGLALQSAFKPKVV